MATVEEAARGVVAALNGISYLLAAQWVADRYKQVFAKTRARHLRRVEQLYIPAAINTGTATFTRDSDIVTGNAAAQAVWTSDLVGRYIRGSIVWYKIITVLPGPQLKIEKKFAEDTQSAVAYYIVSRFNALPPDARWVGDGIVAMRTRRPLQKLSIEELAIEAPARDRVGAQASVYSEGQSVIDANGKVCKSLEIYPYMTTSEVYSYVVYPAPPKLKLMDQLPPEIDEHVLREGALVDAFRFKMAQAIEAGQIEAAATWRNEMRTQETKWKTWMDDAVRADRGVDDLTFILKRANSPITSRDDITNAYDYVMSRWPR
mgnify:CR=1 FL=1